MGEQGSVEEAVERLKDLQREHEAAAEKARRARRTTATPPQVIEANERAVGLAQQRVDAALDAWTASQLEATESAARSAAEDRELLSQQRKKSAKAAAAARWRR